VFGADKCDSKDNLLLNLIGGEVVGRSTGIMH
jgi:hypothetical protein